MKVTTVKTTTTVPSINWVKTITTDDGMRVAVLDGAVDTRHPLGYANLIVHSNNEYESAKEKIKAAYIEFQAEIEKAAEDYTGTVTVVDEDTEEDF